MDELSKYLPGTTEPPDPHLGQISWAASITHAYPGYSGMQLIWCGRIQCYGDTEEAANELRDRIIRGLELVAEKESAEALAAEAIAASAEALEKYFGTNPIFGTYTGQLTPTGRSETPVPTPTDLHRETAARLFGVRPEDVTEAQRRAGKAVNFSQMYLDPSPLLATVRGMQEDANSSTGSSRQLEKDVLFAQRYGQSGPPRTVQFVDFARQEDAALRMMRAMEPLAELLRRSTDRILCVAAQAFDTPGLKTPVRRTVFDFGYTKAYRPGTTLPQIIEDGYCRGFHPSQTLKEARGMGFVVSQDWIEAHWRKLEVEYALGNRPPRLF